MTDPNTVSETHTTPPRQCLGCGYVIDHLPEPRCPECGRKFDPSNPETYWVRPTDAGADAVRCGLKAALAFIVGFGSIAVVILVLTWLPDSVLANVFALIAPAGIGMGFAHASGVVANVRRSIPPWVLNKDSTRLVCARCLTLLEHACWVIAGGCFVMALLMLIGWTCPIL